MELLHGLLGADETVVVEAHVDACDACRRLLSELARLSFVPVSSRAATLPEGPAAEPEPPPPRGLSVGRYLVLDRIGVGGMGVVLSAYDPELDRKVALKLLHPRPRGAARVDLAHEAKIMARLSHPNVCTVHDVGSFAGQVFIAMELVDGPTVRSWLAAEPRPWRRARDLYVDAARGLAAAHALGIVHRDFKPDNVLVGADGRPRVTDFGLAHAGDAGDTAAALVGTPAYMAPEQRARRPATARSDQYAFCVALREALADTPGTPAWLRRALDRGLREDPADRYPSMEATIAALTPDRRRRRVPALVAVAAAAAAAVTLVASRRPPTAADVCAGAAAALAGVWDGARRDGLQAAFVATGLPYANDSFAVVAARLDAWAGEWTAMRRGACEANRGGAQSTTLMDLRLLCLEQRLDEVRALGDVLAAADAGAVKNAVNAAYGLTPLAGCADAAGLAARPPPPRDPGQRARVAAVSAEVARAAALERAGRFRDGLGLCWDAVAEARLLGYRPLLAEALVELGTLLDRVGDGKNAEPLLREAGRAAEAARADDVLVRARLQTLWVVGVSLARPGELVELAADADAAIVRAGDDELQRAALLHRVGAVERAAGDLDAARASLERAAEIRTRRLGDHPELASTLNLLGSVERESGRVVEGEATLARALALRERLLGPSHPLVGATLVNLGASATQRGAYAEGDAYYVRALAVLEPALGAEHPDVATVLGNRSVVLAALGRHDEAIASAERALAIREKIGAEHPATALVLNQLASAYAAGGRHDDSIRAQERAAAIYERTVGAEHPDYAMALSNVGDSRYEQGDYAAAAERHRRALAITEKAYGSGHPTVALMLTKLARDELDRGRPRDALPLLQRALAIQEKDGQPAVGIDPLDLADTRFALARALAAGGERERALALARQALDAFSASAGAQRQAEAARAWLAER